MTGSAVMVPFSPHPRFGEDAIKRTPTLTAITGALTLIGSAATAQTEIQFWHALGGALGEKVDEIADGFSLTGAALPAKGETLGLTVAAENLHFFDPETGRRLH